MKYSCKFTMGVRANVLWTLLGLPLSVMFILYGIYMKCYRESVQLKNKVVFITGASGGLGRACAKAFHSAGCRLVLSGRDVQKLQDLKNELTYTKEFEGYHTPSIVCMDLEDVPSLKAKVADVISCFGHVDIIINNAGKSYRGMACHTTIDVDKLLMDVNYLAHVEITKAVLAQMIERKSGTIVAIGSVQSKIALPHRSAYAASKHALQAYFDSLRAEVSHHNINVCVINPYYVQTNLSVNAVCGDGSNYGKNDPSTKSGLNPDDVADKIVNCVRNKTPEMIIAPFYVQMVIALRVMCPWLYFIIMEHRAKKQNDEMMDKKCS